MASSFDTRHDSRRLADVVVAFDLDNTLTAPDASAYRRTVTEFLTFVDTGLNPVEAFDAYEHLRAKGDALEHLGLYNPIHHRGRADMLALFCLNHCNSAAVNRELGITDTDRRLCAEVVDQASSLNENTRCKGLADRLCARINLQRFCERDDKARRFRERVRQIADHPVLVSWSETYRDAEDKHDPPGDLAGVLNRVSSLGAKLLVISEGLYEVQLEKLRRIGVAPLVERHVLVTQQAADVPGAAELDAAISSRIAGNEPVERLLEDRELANLWYFRTLSDHWKTKTPWFYARCLHALCDCPDDPEEALRNVAIAEADRWRDKQLRFIMIGDRYDKDVAPLIELIGPDAGFTIRFAGGKYRHMHSGKELPERPGPSRTFEDWTSLAEFLTDALSVDSIKPITRPSDVLPRSVLHPGHIEQGLTSNHQAPRHIAQIAADML